MNWVFITDTPPLPDIAHGNHGVARHFIEIVGDGFSMVLTRKFRRYISKHAVSKAAGQTPIKFYPDCAGWGIRRTMPALAGLIDACLFALWLPFFRRGSGRNVRDAFVLLGADPWFLVNVRLAQVAGVSTHVYLVDDIEASLVPRSAWIIRPFLGSLLKCVLLRSVRVFAISNGFVERLNERYACRAEWLPLPSVSSPPDHIGNCAGQAKTRAIAFVGALNHLYNDPLRDLYEEIVALNADVPLTEQYHLEIITYSDPERFLSSLAHRRFVSAFRNLSDSEMTTRLRNSVACFLPYSFRSEDRVMVSTSFSCKILEYYSSGRPILVYGPPYASIPRFFKDEGMQICATSRSELKDALVALQSHDDGKYQKQYSRVWDKYHSPKAIRKFLLRE